MQLRKGWFSLSTTLLIFSTCLFATAHTALAARPQSTISSGLHTTSDSFSESFNVGFGFSIPTPMPAPGHSGVVGVNAQGQLAPAISFSMGDATNTPIPFSGGGNAPAATTGAAISGPGGTAFLTLSATQSNSRSLGGQMGSVTVMDGGTGFVSDSSLVPFVTGVVPVVGSGGPNSNGGGSILGERLGRLKAGEQGRSAGKAHTDSERPSIAARSNPLIQPTESASKSAAASPTAGSGERRRNSSQARCGGRIGDRRISVGCSPKLKARSMPASQTSLRFTTKQTRPKRSHRHHQATGARRAPIHRRHTKLNATFDDSWADAF